ncbi:hypothetical protein B0H10DRAFT_2218431 [Mycena sp. CBHHK59/15]|nr:hypothetical protein B0H10DRAFT_2218431 [Mycena sp. CBHHK59/15]
MAVHLPAIPVCRHHVTDIIITLSSDTSASCLPPLSASAPPSKPPALSSCLRCVFRPLCPPHVLFAAARTSLTAAHPTSTPPTALAGTASVPLLTQVAQPSTHMPWWHASQKFPLAANFCPSMLPELAATNTSQAPPQLFPAPAMPRQLLAIFAALVAALLPFPPLSAAPALCSPLPPPHSLVYISEYLHFHPIPIILSTSCL